MKFNIEGIPTLIEMDDIDIDKLDLDPDNPRIGFLKDNFEKDNLPQDVITFALWEKTDAVRKLRLSIERNQGVLEPIWVVKKNGRFLVIDGNTRVVIYRELGEIHPNNNLYKKIKCKILPEGTKESALDYIKLIAHLRGANDWEVYERARMLYILWEVKGYTYKELIATTKLSINQIKTWIKAYKEMVQQFLPLYGTNSDSLTKFSYFVEFQNPKIQNGMDVNDLTIEDFCKWVGKGEIKRAQDVRNLKKIFNDKKATEILKKKSYKFAIDELGKTNPGFSSKLFESIEDVISGLKNMTVSEEDEIIGGYNNQKRELIMELHGELDKFVKKIK